MSEFVKIPESTFEDLQLDAGLLLNKFDPATPNVQDEDIITATTGGVTASCTPSFSDMGEDVDNCPNNLLEMKKLEGWDAKLSTTALSTKAEVIRMSLGAADVNATTGKITPRVDLQTTDFGDVWWVGRKAGGGFVAVRLINALSTGGFSLKTTKNGKGQLTVELTGHVSINHQDVMPMEFYTSDPDTVTYKINSIFSHVTGTADDTGIAAGEDYTTTLTAESGYTIENVVVTVGGEDVTEDVYTSGTGVVSVENVDGDIVIIATATAA